MLLLLVAFPACLIFKKKTYLVNLLSICFVKSAYFVGFEGTTLFASVELCGQGGGLCDYDNVPPGGVDACLGLKVVFLAHVLLSALGLV